MLNEVWSDIKDYEGYYQVSNHGRVRSVDRYVIKDRTGNLAFKKSRIIAINKQNSGYLYVTLNKCNKNKNFLVHRLVAEAFIPNPDNLEQVNHKDEVKTNNYVDNLEWCTRKYNCNYGTVRQRISQSKKGQKQKPEVIEARRLKLIGKKRSPDCCKKLSELKKGYCPTEETRRKISESLKDRFGGEKSHWYGKHHTDESKKKMSESKKGKQVGDKNPMYGRHHTEDAKKRMGLNKKIKVAQYSKTGELIKIWDSMTDAGRELNINITAIWQCCNGRYKSSGGFIWKYA